MNLLTSNNKQKLGFTIVEMLVIITVLGTLIGLMAFGWANWRQTAAKTSVKSDINTAAIAMEDAKNFGNGYPLGLPSTYKPSGDVTVSYIGGDSSNYCLESRSTKVATVVYYVDTTVTKAPQSGTCGSNFTIGTPIASLSAVTTSSITVSWGAVTSATSYQVKYGPSSPTITSACSSSPCTLSGLSNSTNYEISVTANSQYNTATSAVINATTTTPPTFIATGFNFSCAVLAGVPYCSGRNQNGQLGNNSLTDTLTRVPVNTSGVLAGLTIKNLYLGAYHACVIASNDLPYCWGNGTNGKLGNGSLSDSLVPTAVVTSGVLSGKTVKELSTASNTTCAIASDNLPYCWGYNYFGQLGNGGTTDSTVPVAVTMSGVLAGKTAKSISTGGDHTCIIASDNNPYCWGYGISGRLGNGGTANSNVPTAVVTTGVLSGKTSTKVVAGYGGNTCVIASGDAYCWGDNAPGELGNGTTGGGSATPVAVTKTGVLSGKTITDMTTGTQSVCVIASDSKPYCWGSGSGGKLGDGLGTDSNVPVAVTANGSLNGRSAQSIIGIGSQCVLTTTSEIHCWGQNNFGQHANGTTTPALAPVQIYN